MEIVNPCLVPFTEEDLFKVSLEELREIHELCWECYQEEKHISSFSDNETKLKYWDKLLDIVVQELEERKSTIYGW